MGLETCAGGGSELRSAGGSSSSRASRVGQMGRSTELLRKTVLQDALRAQNRLGKASGGPLGGGRGCPSRGSTRARSYAAILGRVPTQESCQYTRYPAFFCDFSRFSTHTPIFLLIFVSFRPRFWVAPWKGILNSMSPRASALGSPPTGGGCLFGGLWVRGTVPWFGTLPH